MPASPGHPSARVMPRRARAARGARRRPWKPEPASRRRPGGRVVSRTGLRGPAVTRERRVPPNGKGTRRANGLSAGGTARHRESGELEDFRIARSGTRTSRSKQAGNTGATAFEEQSGQPVSANVVARFAPGCAAGLPLASRQEPDPPRNLTAASNGCRCTAFGFDRDRPSTCSLQTGRFRVPSPGSSARGMAVRSRRARHSLGLVFDQPRNARENTAASA